MCNASGTTDASLFSSLEPPELNVETSNIDPAGEYPDDTQLAERFRHSGWRRNRALIYDAFRRTRQSQSRLDNFRDCGSNAYVYVSTDPPITYRLGGSSCRDRFCLPCSIDRSRCLATNVLNELKGKTTRFITLTLKQRNDHLRDILDRITTCFRKLRARSWWQAHVDGGCGFIEIKYSHKNDDWNVHLHLIVHGRYLPQSDLSRNWYSVTGDSHIVDVRFVHDNERVGRYVTKYVSKPFNNTFLNRDELLETVINSTVNRRLCLTFGDWRGIKLTESPNQRDWINLGTFHDIVTRAVLGDQQCLDAVQAICHETTPTILSAVRKARPPPPPPAFTQDQLFFSWPAIDPRF